MSIQARDNRYGGYSFNGTWDNEWTDYRRNGAIESSQHPVSGEVHSCGRKNHTSNPQQTVQGIANFRKPSSYGRYVYEQKPLIGMWSWNYTGTNQSQLQTLHSEKVGPYRLGAINNVAWPGPWAGPYPSTSYIGFSNLMNRCTAECLVKLGDMKANLAEDLATARMTFNLFSGLVFDGLTAIVAIREGNFSKAAKVLGVRDSRKLAGRYLEYTYGWKPLIDDMIGTHDLVKQALQRPSLYISAKRTVKEGFTTDAQGKTSKGITGTASCSMGLIAKISNEYLHIAQQTGLIDPVLLGWELIPYSFVVDWILPIGTYIQAMQATYGLTFVSGWKGYRVECQGKYIGTPDPGWTEESPRGLTSAGFAYQRDALTGFPQPIPYVKSPFSTFHAVNVLALLRQRFR